MIFLLCIIIAILLFGSSAVIGAFGVVLGFIAVGIGFISLSAVSWPPLSTIVMMAVMLIVGVIMALLLFGFMVQKYGTDGNPNLTLKVFLKSLTD